MEELLNNIYYDSGNPAGFSSVQKLYNAAKNKDPGVKYSDVKNWLSKQITYTLHRPAKRNFLRNKILVGGVKEQYQADLVDLSMFKSYNRGYSYIITIIDCFSRYAWAIPLKNKSAESILHALKSVFNYSKPEKLQTDRGKEFLNSKVQNYLNDENISFFTTHNATFKCAIVERFNRTLKGQMWKRFTKNGNRNYIDHLENILFAYNNSYHRTINPLMLIKKIKI